MTTVAARLQTLAALALTALAVTVGAASTAVAGDGSDDICVGVVVDASALGAGVDSDCATVPKGSDGTDVLDAAGHTLTVCSDGIIGEIDGRPHNGCETKDSTHYWSYWHRAPGSSTWTYASEGPATYEPPDRSTEGWVWQDGGSENQPPPDTAYRSICPRTTSPSPSSPPPPAGTEYHPHTAPAAPKPVPRATVTPAITTPPPAPPPTETAKPRRTHTEKHVDRIPSASPSPTAASPSPASTAVAEPAANSSSGFPVTIVAAVAAVLALAGATAWQVRRQRDQS